VCFASKMGPEQDKPAEGPLPGKQTSGQRREIAVVSVVDFQSSCIWNALSGHNCLCDSEPVFQMLMFNHGGSSQNVVYPKTGRISKGREPVKYHYHRRGNAKLMSTTRNIRVSAFLVTHAPGSDCM